MHILRVENLSLAFGKMLALNGVNCSVSKHELMSIIGPNGAGKTTFFNVVSGTYRPTSGRIFFKEERIDGLSPFQIVTKGLARSFQIVNLFPDLTVFSNVRVAVLAQQQQGMRLWPSVDKLNKVTDLTYEILDLVHLAEKSGQVANSLSHGDQKCLEMAMALASRPDLMLLDEPTAGMGPEETSHTVKLIKDIWEKTGITIIFSEHDMDMVFGISTRIMVLHGGQVIADGSVQAIRNDPNVREAYLGDLA